jgi:hypothetical protein
MGLVILAQARIQYCRLALDAGSVIPDLIRDRHDQDNSFNASIKIKDSMNP